MDRKLDSYDRKILARLQHQGDVGPGDLSETIHLSISQCSRRLQRLKGDNYVKSTVALLDESKLNIGITAYIRATLTSHAPDHARQFHERMRSYPEVTECHKITGEADYLIKVCTKDLASYNKLVTEQLLASADVGQVRSSIVLESIKSTTQLPLDFL